MMVTKLGQQYNVGEKKPTIILDTYIVVTNGYVIPVAYSFLNVCMYGQHFQQSMVWINPLSFPVLVPARECRLARQVRQSRPASASRSFPIPLIQYNLYVEQTAPAAAESRACVRGNYAIHSMAF